MTNPDAPPSERQIGQGDADADDITVTMTFDLTRSSVSAAGLVRMLLKVVGRAAGARCTRCVWDDCKAVEYQPGQRGR